MEEAKLIQASTLQGQKREFIIFNSPVIGKGSYGTVKRAIQKDKPYQQLAVKILPYINQKQKIQKEIQILKKLPLHPNLVRIIPLKCFSERNFYIFMQYCGDGTLQSLIRKQLSEKQIFTICYQIINGYKVLYDAKILHQDLKPDNILIKNKVLKITDFGFSLLYENMQPMVIREGTLPYMPLQKLTDKVYYPSVAADIYAIGVIIFKLITKHHPYITKRQSVPDHIRALKNNPIILSPFFMQKYSFKFQHFFQIVLRMLQKQKQKRIQFKQIYQYILKEEQFFKREQQLQQQSLYFSQPTYSIIQCSQAISIPFTIQLKKQPQYIETMNGMHFEQLQLNKQQIVQKIQRYILNSRLIVYFIDRFSRRLYIEQLKYQMKNYKSTILGLLLLQRKIIQKILAEARQQSVFSVNEWRVFKSARRQLLSLIKKDQMYMNDIITDCIIQCSQVNTHMQKKLLDQSKLSINEFVKQIQALIIMVLEQKASFIDCNNHPQLITLCYGFDCLKLLSLQHKWGVEDLGLGHYVRELETNDSSFLIKKIQSYADKYKIQYLLCTEEVKKNKN